MTDVILAQPNRLTDIQTWLVDHKQPSFRVKQISQAWYTQPSWEEVTTLSKELRNQLDQQFAWLSLQPFKVFTSPNDGTKKAILSLPDGLRVETVLMPNARKKFTVCISSQVGCGMGCTFCATGTMGLLRNLTVDEIVDQVRFWKFTEPEADISNIVFMGMGEPLANYDNVKLAAKIFLDDMAFGPTHVVVSTVGFAAGLQRILKDDTFPPVRLALSIHAGTDETRNKIVPAHKGNSMEKIGQWAKQFLEVKGNRRHHLTLEYVMLKQVNDMPEEAKALVKTFMPIRQQIKLNLIPWNPTKMDMERSPESRLHQFKDITEQAGIATTIRYSKGLDITAACGQLVINSKTV